ncbi:uncharacterized protein Dere_GG20833 [Drosophila erecta]|uniref:Uncharacterized protein n=1 Tax=Drosophila erecta TaxID=7220 RepID=A0A0Q5VVD8_DROER|nr:uncharacterized protein Dere_GG20833 [Drosophila erecta]
MSDINNYNIHRHPNIKPYDYVHCKSIIFNDNFNRNSDVHINRNTTTSTAIPSSSTSDSTTPYTTSSSTASTTTSTAFPASTTTESTSTSTKTEESTTTSTAIPTSSTSDSSITSTASTSDLTTTSTAIPTSTSTESTSTTTTTTASTTTSTAISSSSTSDSTTPIHNNRKYFNIHKNRRKYYNIYRDPNIFHIRLFDYIHCKYIRFNDNLYSDSHVHINRKYFNNHNNNCEYYNINRDPNILNIGLYYFVHHKFIYCFSYNIYGNSNVHINRKYFNSHNNNRKYYNIYCDPNILHIGLYDYVLCVNLHSNSDKLQITSMPQSVTSLCHFYPRLCLKPEEAQFVRLADEYGKPLLLISSFEGRAAYSQKLPALWRAISRTHNNK